MPDKLNKLVFHDEKTYNFWGGLYEAPVNDDDDTPDSEYIQVAAICEHPAAEKRARLFCEAEQMADDVAMLLGPMESLVSGVVPEWDERIESLRAILTRLSPQGNPYE